MRAIIRVILPTTTDDQAVKVKKAIEKALADVAVEKEIEMNLMSR